MELLPKKPGINLSYPSNAAPSIRGGFRRAAFRSGPPRPVAPHTNLKLNCK